MQVQNLADPPVTSWQDHRRAVDDDTDVTDQRGVEYLVECCAIGEAALTQPSERGSISSREWAKGLHNALRYPPCQHLPRQSALPVAARSGCDTAVAAQAMCECLVEHLDHPCGVPDLVRLSACGQGDLLQQREVGRGVKRDDDHGDLVRRAAAENCQLLQQLPSRDVAWRVIQ